LRTGSWAEQCDLPLATLDRRLARATGPRCRFLLPSLAWAPAPRNIASSHGAAARAGSRSPRRLRCARRLWCGGWRLWDSGQVRDVW